MAGGVESWSSLSAEGEAKLGMVMEFSLDESKFPRFQIFGVLKGFRVIRFD